MLPPGEGAPVYADQFFFERAVRLDAHFQARDLRALYEEWERVVAEATNA